MADVKWIKVPTNFFDIEPIISIEKLPKGDSIILLYLELLCETYRKSRKGIFSLFNHELTDKVLDSFFGHYSNIGEKLSVLESYGLIKRTKTSISVFKFWQDKHDRNSDRYKQWRKDVFTRDKFQCQHCGIKKDIQAHHIKSWKSREDLRYVVENGITLCRSCHLKAHGGCWKNECSMDKA